MFASKLIKKYPARTPCLILQRVDKSLGFEIEYLQKYETKVDKVFICQVNVLGGAHSKSKPRENFPLRVQNMIVFLFLYTFVQRRDRRPVNSHPSRGSDWPDLNMDENHTYSTVHCKN